MRNSVLPIPWTQRDSRPKSQAELDEEEQFDIYKAKHLAVPRHCRTELDRLLGHYQDMMSRMIEDPEFAARINYESDSFTREAQKRAEASLARLREKPLYKNRFMPEERELRERKPEGAPAPPPAYFEHLNLILDDEELAEKKLAFMKEGGLKHLGPLFDEHGHLDPTIPDWICREYQSEIVEEYLRQKE